MEQQLHNDYSRHKFKTELPQELSSEYGDRVVWIEGKAYRPTGHWNNGYTYRHVAELATSEHVEKSAAPDEDNEMKSKTAVCEAENSPVSILQEDTLAGRDVNDGNH
jgi:hypothetical protein